MHKHDRHATGRVNKAFHLVLEAAPAEQAIKNALKESVNFENYEGLVKRATESGVITEEQATMVRLAQQACARVIEVDDFPPEKIADLSQTPDHAQERDLTTLSETG